MMRTARLARAIQTQWGMFAPGIIVKLIAAEGDTAVVDFGIGDQHMYSVIRSQSVEVYRPATWAAVA